MLLYQRPAIAPVFTNRKQIQKGASLSRKEVKSRNGIQRLSAHSCQEAVAMTAGAAPPRSFPGTTLGIAASSRHSFTCAGFCALSQFILRIYQQDVPQANYRSAVHLFWLKEVSWEHSTFGQRGKTALPAATQQTILSICKVRSKASIMFQACVYC